MTTAVLGQAVYGQTVYGNYTTTTTPGGGGGGPVLGATAWTFTRDPTSPTRMRRPSIQRISVIVRALTAGAPVDPTAGTVQFAFTAGPTPTAATGTAAPGQALYGMAVLGQTIYGAAPTGTWIPGTWETWPGPPRQYAARCLVGPGQPADLARGSWIVWVRVTDTPEVPVRAIGTLHIT